MIQATQQNIARDLYIKEGKTQTAIAAQLGVHPKTISYWVKQNNWHEIKTSIAISPLMIRHNLYTQLGSLSEYIVTREEGNNFPTAEEVTMQSKLVQAIFKFPNYTVEDVQQIRKEIDQANKNIAAKQAPASDKETIKNIDSQAIITSARDKEGIKNPEVPALENDGYIPKKNVVLRSGVRWIEKGIVFDPSTRKNRALRQSEYEELLRKGLTKADFQGWHL